MNAKEFYSQFMGPSDVVFDIGANVGNRTGVFSDLARRVIAVEPQERLIGALKENFFDRTNIRYVNKAVGDSAGYKRIMLCTTNGCDTLSSFSQAWIRAVKDSGRFSMMDWKESGELIEMTTLDRLIEEFGRPSFIKIDVEGYELAVLHGLSSPVPALSFEITPKEFLGDALCCITWLDSHLGMRRFNYSLGESLDMALPSPVSADEIIKCISQYTDNVTFGDVYAWT